MLYGVSNKTTLYDPLVINEETRKLNRERLIQQANYINQNRYH